MTDPLEAALGYADTLAVGVVPIIGKRPAAQHGYSSASSDPDQIRRMFAHCRATGVGIAAGERLVILDIDRVESVTELPGELPRSLTARSGSGGFHVYFSRPDGLTLSYRPGRLPDGIEVKLGNAGCVAPPSVHESGRMYEWVRRLPIIPTPGWLLDLLKPEPRPAYTGHLTGGETPYGRAALERQTRQVALAREGSRNRTLNSACYGLAQLVPSGHLRPEQIHDALFDAGLVAGLPAREVVATIRQALVQGQAKPYWPEERR